MIVSVVSHGDSCITIQCDMCFSDKKDYSFFFLPYTELIALAGSPRDDYQPFSRRCRPDFSHGDH